MKPLRTYKVMRANGKLKLTREENKVVEVVARSEDEAISRLEAISKGGNFTMLGSSSKVHASNFVGLQVIVSNYYAKKKREQDSSLKF